MNLKLTLTILASLVWITASNGQGTIQIRFDAPPQLPSQGESFFVQEYSESAMWFRPLGVVGPGNGFSRRRGGGQLSGIPDNGTAYLATALGDSLAFSLTNESPFALVSVDLAEYSTVLSDPVTVPFIGYRQDGSTVIASFTTDGIIDGSGPLADFETFTFDSSWVGLTRVEISTWGWSLDNLIVVIPEPSSGTLMIVAGISSLWLRRRLQRNSRNKPLQANSEKGSL